MSGSDTGTGGLTPAGPAARSLHRLPGLRWLYSALVGLGCAVALVAVGMGAQRAIDASQLSAPSAAADPEAGNYLDSNAPAQAAPPPAAAEPSAAAAPQPAALGVHIPGARAPSLAEIDPAAPAAVAIHIPRLRINRSLVGLHIQPDQSLSVPKSFHDVGWWSEGPHPGAAGATVVAGHVSSTSGPGVFVHLADLRDGDKVTVDRADQSSATFQVVGKASYPRSAFPDNLVYRTRGKPSIHLVTCDGGFNTAIGHHEDNLIVFADLVSTTLSPVQRRAAEHRAAHLKTAEKKAAEKKAAEKKSAQKAATKKAAAKKAAAKKAATKKAAARTAAQQQAAVSTGTPAARSGPGTANQSGASRAAPLPGGFAQSLVCTKDLVCRPGPLQ